MKTGTIKFRKRPSGNYSVVDCRADVVGMIYQKDGSWRLIINGYKDIYEAATFIGIKQIARANFKDRNQ